MNVALACGGTGGHIFPGLATASVLQDRGHSVVLWLAGKDVEQTAVEGWPGEVITVPADGYPPSFSFRGVSVTWSLCKAAVGCTKRMRQAPPDVLLAMGSYASVGPVCAAFRLHVPVVLHEANVLPGRAIALFSRWATTVAASFEETRYYLRRRNLVVTGMPLRWELDAKSVSVPPELDRNLLTILVMGGSRGAQRLNEVASEAVMRLHAQGLRLQVIHLSGWEVEQKLKEQYAAAGLPAEVFGFAQDMASVYRSTDLAICRAGASTCSELAAFGVPALLVPYPYASQNHQTMNAKALEKAGGADVIAERDFSVDWLIDYISECFHTPARLARMSAAMKKRAMSRGAEALADVVERAARAA